MTSFSPTSTPLFIFTPYPTPSITVSSSYNGTFVPTSSSDGSMSTIVGLAGASFGMMTAFFGVYLSQYIPKGTFSSIMSWIPQSWIDRFKRDPMGSIRQLANMVKDPKKAIQDAVLSKMGMKTDDKEAAVEQETPPIETKVELPQLEEKPVPPPAPPIPQIPTVLRPAFGIRR